MASGRAVLQSPGPPWLLAQRRLSSKFPLDVESVFSQLLSLILPPSLIQTNLHPVTPFLFNLPTEKAFFLLDFLSNRKHFYTSVTAGKNTQG